MKFERDSDTPSIDLVMHVVMAVVFFVTVCCMILPQAQSFLA